jgi:hypothetical protein
MIVYGPVAVAAQPVERGVDARHEDAAGVE